MKAFVTGGAGFIGSNLVDALIARGDTVEVLDDLSTGKASNLEGALAAGAVLHEADLRDGERLAELVAAAAPDVVFHLAAQIDVRRAVADPGFDAQVNVGGTINVLEAARRAGVRRVVNSSTGGAIYGDAAVIPTPEDHLAAPMAPYGQSKLAAEGYLGLYGRLHGLASVSLRYANVYGPRQDPHGEAGVVAIFCGRILQGRGLTIFGDGLQTRDYVYVGDVAEAMWYGATKPLPPVGLLDARAFNVGTGIGTSVVDMANILLEEAGTKVPLEFAPRRPGAAQESFVDIGKAERLLGWKPRVTLREGLAQSFRWAADRQAATAGSRA